MTSRGTLPPYILINDLASLVTIDIFVFSFWICFEFKWICFSICFGLMNLSIWLIKEYWDMFKSWLILYVCVNLNIDQLTLNNKNEKNILELPTLNNKNEIINSWKKNSSVIAMDMAMGIVDICEKYNCG